ncbi:hypothetical protein GCM10027161_60550 [Microbispora hainanensis]
MPAASYLLEMIQEAIDMPIDPIAAPYIMLERSPILWSVLIMRVPLEVFCPDSGRTRPDLP